MRKIPFVILTLIWGFTVVHYGDLPEVIPTHYNVAGEPDAFGQKQNIFFLPILMSVIAGGLLAIEKKVKTVIERNILLGVNLLTALMFGYIQIQTFFIALGRSSGLGQGFLAFSLGGTILLMIVSIIKNSKKTKVN